MGLDWCLKRKLREGHNPVADEKKLEKLEEKQAVLWDKYLKKHNKGEQPGVYPNLIQAAFAAQPGVIKLATELEALEEVVATHYTSPMEVLGAPRVGIDIEATEYLRVQHNQWKHDYEKDPSNLRAPPPWKEHLKNEHGKYVADLAKNKDGLGACTGIMTGAESFRGKIIGYSQDVIGSDLADAAYNDKNSLELIQYGEQLLAATRKYVKNHRLPSNLEEMTSAQVQVLDESDNLWNAWYCFQGANWCIFWGTRGFELYAWS